MARPVARRVPVKAARIPAKRRLRPVPGLTINQQGFALDWLANGYNAALAYRRFYPEASVATAETNGPRLLRNAQVKHFITQQVERTLGSMQMAVDEAMGRLALISRATLDMAFDEHDNLRPPSAWPPALKEAARLYDGEQRKLQLTDKLQSLRTILELAGKLRNPMADSVDALAEAILADRERRRREQHTARSGGK